MGHSLVWPVRGRWSAVRLAAVLGATLLLMGVMTSAARAQLPTTDDPRVGLDPGLDNAEVAKRGLDLTAHLNKPPTFTSPVFPGTIADQIPFANSDLAFQGDHAFVGNFNGFNIYDISNPAAPTLRTSVVCPGGQGDVSVYRNLLFMSVEENRANKDCSSTPATAETRFRGVRIFDIGNLNAPVQVGGVQTCRGSHTHTLVTDKHDSRNVYIYVQGTAGVRPATELAGCDATTDPTAANPSRWRIEVIKVPLAAPQDAQIVSEPRLFKNEAGAIDGLQNAPQTPLHPSGIPWQPTPTTDSCHDITVYPKFEIAAGACEGNGLLIDISNPADPKRIDAVADPLYAYWHGATFSNDGKTVVFTDEWGGGTNPRCRATDQLSWGGNSIYDIVGGNLKFRSYYKIPPVQTTEENCVSHIPSLVPVPGRDIFVQAWYQGGASLVDFTDSSHPVEIGFYDRGPIHPSVMVLGGLWSTYWYNGETYGSEIARGLDVYGLTPTAQLSENEIAAAREVQVERLNVQHQDKIRWTPSFAVVRSFVDQLVRAGDIDATTLDEVNAFVDRAERFDDRGQTIAAKATLAALAGQLSGERYEQLRDALIDLARELLGRGDPPRPFSGCVPGSARLVRRGLATRTGHRGTRRASAPGRPARSRRAARAHPVAAAPRGNRRAGVAAVRRGDDRRVAGGQPAPARLCGGRHGGRAGRRRVPSPPDGRLPESAPAGGGRPRAQGAARLRAPVHALARAPGAVGGGARGDRGGTRVRRPRARRRARAGELHQRPAHAGGAAEGVGSAVVVSRALKRAAHAVGAHRITTRPCTRRIRVELHGQVLAESDRAVALDETGLPTRYYLPREDVRTDLLTPSDTTSTCPFKGDATYFSAAGARDAFWVYESPSEEDALAIAGMLAPWPGRVDVFVDGKKT
jgi:uncharacterized protein (DUF427 family)